MKRVAMAVVVLAAMLGTARAQVVQGADTVRYQKRTLIDFGDPAHLVGTLTKPDVSIDYAPKAAKFTSLIKYRVSFNPELQNTAAKL